MTQYRYVAYTREGEEREGVEDAASESELARRLLRRRMVLARAAPVARRRTSMDVTERLVGELAALLEGGMVLERALQVLAQEGSDDHRLAALAATLRDALKRGQSLSQALDASARFDPLLVPLVRAGEASGRLAATLSLLERHYEARRRLRGELLATLTYPAILLLVSLLSLVGLGVYVIPVFRDLFEDGAADLPLGTRIIFATSDFLIAHGVTLALVAGALVIGTGLAVRLLPAVRRARDALALRLPVLGPIIALAESGRLLTVLGVLLERNVQLVDALDLARDSLRNAILSEGLAEAIQRLRRGLSLPAAIAAMPQLPGRAVQLLRVGDETGQLARACRAGGERLQQQLTLRLNALVSLAGPLIIVVMGGLVGFVVVSMLLAVFGIAELGTAG